MGGHATLDSYGSMGRDQREIDAEGPRLVPAHHRRFLESLALALDLRVDDQRYWVVHAGVSMSHSYVGLRHDEVVPWLVEHDPTSLLWANVDPEAALPLDAPVVHGHKSRDAPLDLGHVIAIDTRAGVPGGRLTALLLPAREFLTAG
jgi:hypothetical protein